MKSSIGPGTAFVGREQEMAALRAALEDSLTGHGRLVMLAGEPGIGKTRMAQELASSAEALGARSLWGWCYEEEGAPSYWPWVQVVRSYVQHSETERLRSEMGPGAADIAQIVPELRVKLPNLEPQPTLEPEQARFRLFDSITIFLKNASQARPLVIVLDDLHWADRSSLQFLDFLAKEVGECRVLLIGTYRDTDMAIRHPLTQALGNVGREQLFRRVQLVGFTLPEVAEFIEASAGVKVPHSTLEVVRDRTEGNPLFLGEIVRFLSKEELLDLDRWQTALPEGVRDVIGRRLSRLSALCNQVLTTASVIGREFDFNLLRALVGEVTEQQLLMALDEALEAHMLEGLSGQVERYRFTHALTQGTLVQELPTTRRIRLHAQVAETLEQRYGTEAEAHADELAYHLAQAESVVGTEKLVRYSLAAGEGALASYAYEEALVHFQRGLSAKGIQETANAIEETTVQDKETAALFFGLGRAQSAVLGTHQVSEAVANLVRAFDYYAAVGDAEQAVAVAEYPLYVPSFRLPGIPELITRALAMVPADSPAAGRLLSRYGWFKGMQDGDYGGACDAFEQALSIAERDGDPALQMRTLANAAEVEAYFNHGDEMLDRGMRAVMLAPLVDDPRAELLARYWACFRQIAVGDTAGASTQAGELLTLAERLRHHFYLARALFVNESVSRLQGHWLAAREYNDRGLAISPYEPRLLAARVALECEVGDIHQSEIHLERIIDAAALTAPGPTNLYSIAAMMIPAAARLTGRDHRAYLAESAAASVLSSRSATPLMTMLAHIGTAFSAVMRRDAAAAAAQYPVLKPNEGTLLVFLIAADRLLGLLAATIGRNDLAAAHFEEALAFCCRAGFWPELAWTCFDYADALIQRNGPDDRERAMSLLGESLAISQELSMRPLMERVFSRRENLRA